MGLFPFGAFWFAGGPAPLIATRLLHETGTPYSISIHIILAAIITIGCVAALLDRSRMDIEDAASTATHQIRCIATDVAQQSQTVAFQTLSSMMADARYRGLQNDHPHGIASAHAICPS